MGLNARVKQKLVWYKFEATSEEWHRMILPSVYAGLFEDQLKQLMNKAPNGWLDTKNPEFKICYFKDLKANEERMIRDFCNTFKNAVVIQPNEYIRACFSNQLAACFALDMHMNEGERTEIGEMVYQAKYNGKHKLVNNLSAELCRLIQKIPEHDGIVRRITYVPPEPNKQFHLPMELARMMARRLGEEFFFTPKPLVHCRLMCSKKALKDLPMEDKIPAWDRLMVEEKIELSGEISGACVYLIDDIYQSGSTMWSVAKFLRQCGARHVVGLTCVKTWRDTDNR